MSLKEYFDCYQRRWFFQTKMELIFVIAWHAFVNFCHCLPLWVVGSEILSHSVRMEENGFPQTKSELDSLSTVKILMIISPIIVVFVVPLIQFGCLYLYYMYGHPWCRMFGHFKKPGATKSMVLPKQKLNVSA